MAAMKKVLAARGLKVKKTGRINLCFQTASKKRNNWTYPVFPGTDPSQEALGWIPIILSVSTLSIYIAFLIRAIYFRCGPAKKLHWNVLRGDKKHKLLCAASHAFGGQP